MAKPSIAEILTASGYTNYTPELVSRASNALYGNVGANTDERNWTQIMQASNPLAAAEAALRAQWQDGSYLLPNAAHLVSAGYPDFAPELTYRQMSQRLTYNYSTAWSAGSTFAANSALSDTALGALAQAYAVAQNTPTLSVAFTSTSASLTLSHSGQLSYSITGSPATAAAGAYALTPEGVGAVVREGLVTLTRDSGYTGNSSFFVLVGTDTAINRSYPAAATVVDRLIVLGVGNDTIAAGHGNDTIFGGDGADTILGNQGNDIIYGGNGADSLEGGQGNDTLFGGAGADTLWGGSTGSDRLTGDGGADQMQFTGLNSGTVVTDFSAAQGDTISLRNGNNFLVGAVQFSAGLNPFGTPLLAADFDAVADLTLVRSDTGGASAGNNQVYVITNQQSQAQLQAAVPVGALKAYVMVYDSTSGQAVLLFDDDWSTPGNRIQVASFSGLSAADVQALVLGNFQAWAG